MGGPITVSRSVKETAESLWAQSRPTVDHPGKAEQLHLSIVGPNPIVWVQIPRAMDMFDSRRLGCRLRCIKFVRRLPCGCTLLASPGLRLTWLTSINSGQFESWTTTQSDRMSSYLHSGSLSQRGRCISGCASFVPASHTQTILFRRASRSPRFCIWRRGTFEDRERRFDWITSCPYGPLRAGAHSCCSHARLTSRLSSCKNADAASNRPKPSTRHWPTTIPDCSCQAHADAYCRCKNG